MKAEEIEWDYIPSGECTFRTCLATALRGRSHTHRVSMDRGPDR